MATPASVLAILAHPDDEIFVAGMLAHLAELRLSCARLGIGEPRFLGFHDSGRGDKRQWNDPRALAVADMLEVEAAIREVIRDLRPRVIITHDPHGCYYHPDHLALQ